MIPYGRPRRFPPNNERVGRGMGGSQAGEGGLTHPQTTYISPKLFLLLACFITSLKKEKTTNT
jgi:hypothetical protein